MAFISKYPDGQAVDAQLDLATVANATADTALTNAATAQSTADNAAATAQTAQTTADNINTLIPETATTTNPLVDEDGLNAAISQISARRLKPVAVLIDPRDYIWNSMTDLQNAANYYYQGESVVPTVNDIAVVYDGDGNQWRCCFDGVEWNAEYEIITALTESQQAALDSEITYALTQLISSALQTTDIIDNLTTTAANKALSALQGYNLQQNKLDISAKAADSTLFNGRNETQFFSYSMATGIITGNGELAIGWAPRAVFVFGNRFNNTSTDFVMQSVAFANGNAATHRQVNTINGTVTTVLETTSLGFITRTMIGGQSFDPPVSATAPLRYIAFR